MSTGKQNLMHRSLIICVKISAKLKCFREQSDHQICSHKTQQWNAVWFLIPLLSYDVWYNRRHFYVKHFQATPIYPSSNLTRVPVQFQSQFSALWTFLPLFHCKLKMWRSSNLNSDQLRHITTVYQHMQLTILISALPNFTSCFTIIMSYLSLPYNKNSSHNWYTSYLSVSCRYQCNWLPDWLSKA